MVQLVAVTDSTQLYELNQLHQAQAEHAYVCLEQKQIKAVLFYTIQKQKGMILKITTQDEDMLDGLVRICFARLLDMGIQQAEFSSDMDVHLLEKLGFVHDGSFCVYSLSEIINNCRKCKKN